MLIVCLKNFAVIYFGCVALIQHELFYLVISCVYMPYIGMVNTSQTMANYGIYYFFYAVYTLFNATCQFYKYRR